MPMVDIYFIRKYGRFDIAEIDKSYRPNGVNLPPNEQSDGNKETGYCPTTPIYHTNATQYDFLYPIRQK